MCLLLAILVCQACIHITQIILSFCLIQCEKPCTHISALIDDLTITNCFFSDTIRDFLERATRALSSLLPPCSIPLASNDDPKIKFVVDRSRKCWDQQKHPTFHTYIQISVNPDKSSFPLIFSPFGYYDHILKVLQKKYNKDKAQIYSLLPPASHDAQSSNPDDEVHLKECSSLHDAQPHYDNTELT